MGVHDDAVAAAPPSEISEADMVGLMNSVLQESVPAMHGLGIRVVELRPGHAVGEAPMAGNSNHMGTMYAGTLFGLAEMLGGALFAVSFDYARFYPTVKDLQISYLRPTRTDVRAEATMGLATIEALKSELETASKVEFVLEAVLTDTTGEVVATTRGTYQIRAVRTA
jgi:thioesterase domain-containing protein